MIPKHSVIHGSATVPYTTSGVYGVYVFVPFKKIRLRRGKEENAQIGNKTGQLACQFSPPSVAQSTPACSAVASDYTNEKHRDGVKRGDAQHGRRDSRTHNKAKPPLRESAWCLDRPADRAIIVNRETT